jgi:hypothetical protein
MPAKSSPSERADRMTAAPLRGEAAWRASKKEIAARNDTARAAGVRRRAEKESEAAIEAARRDKREAQGLPHQPGR